MITKKTYMLNIIHMTTSACPTLFKKLKLYVIQITPYRLYYTRCIPRTHLHIDSIVTHPCCSASILHIASVNFWIFERVTISPNWSIYTWDQAQESSSYESERSSVSPKILKYEYSPSTNNFLTPHSHPPFPITRHLPLYIEITNQVQKLIEGLKKSESMRRLCECLLNWASM